jgi:hypothetical protein
MLAIPADNLNFVTIEGYISSIIDKMEEKLEGGKKWSSWMICKVTI